MHARFLRPTLRVYRAAGLSSMTTPRCTSQGTQDYRSVIREIQDDEYDTQLEAKRSKIEALFSEYSTPSLEVFESKPRHYRMRYVCRVM